GLRNKKYHWLNKPLSKEEYENKLSEFHTNISSHTSVLSEWQTLKMKLPRQCAVERMTENCTGNYILESKDCRNCFDAQFSETCTHCQNITTLKDSMDVTFFGYDTELLYECNNVGLQTYHCLFCSYSYEGSS